MKNKFGALVVLGLCGVFPATGFSADVAAIIQDCVGCHGADGVSEYPDMPTIAGVSTPVHEDAMFAYQDGARPCETSEYRHGDMSRPKTDMCKIAKALTEDQIVAVAAHFAGKKFVAMKQSTDPAKSAAGKAVHDRDCKRCHSDDGSNPEDDAGIIAGQPMGYLERTFKEYRAETRDQPKNMKAKIAALSDADIEALIHFYASQQ